MRLPSEHLPYLLGSSLAGCRIGKFYFCQMMELVSRECEAIRERDVVLCLLDRIINPSSMTKYITADHSLPPRPSLPSPRHPPATIDPTIHRSYYPIHPAVPRVVPIHWHLRRATMPNLLLEVDTHSIWQGLPTGHPRMHPREMVRIDCTLLLAGRPKYYFSMRKEVE